MNRGSGGLGVQSEERPMVEVYDKQGELMICMPLQDLIVRAMFRNLDMQSGLGDPPWPVAVSGVFVAPITSTDEVKL